MAQVLKPTEVDILAIILIIGVLALVTELTQVEEIAKTLVIPSLVLLIAVTGYTIFRTSRLREI
jgi:ABC-type nickel/cobalt efflux system permease component RcnA